MIIANIMTFGTDKFNFIIEPEYQAILDQSTVLGFAQPTRKEKYYQNNLVKELKASGTWYKLDELYIFSHSAGTDFSTINWINPIRKITRLVTDPNLSYSVNKDGYVSVGGSGLHFSSNYNPSIALENYKLNDASFGFVLSNALANTLPLNSGVHIVLGINDAGTKRASYRETAKRFHLQRGTSFFTISNLPAPNLGSFVGFYLKENVYRVFENTTKKITINSQITDTDVDLNFNYISMGPDGGGANAMTRLIFVGGSLTDLQHIDLSISWTNYFNKIQ
jgi:hypothetical protein